MIAFITDLHFGMKSGHEQTFESQMVFYEKQFFPYLIEHEIKHVICPGDIFDNRTNVNIFVLQELRERFFSWFADNGINFHWLLGNHDIVSNSTLKWNVAQATGLDKLDFINLINKPTKLQIGDITFGLVPWVCDELEIPTGVDIVCGHFEMSGFSVTKGIESKHGHNPTGFKKYKAVLSGHFHIADQKGNITYLGNPYQKDWGDFNLVKGFWTLDENLELKQHENLYSPRHINLVYNENESGFTLDIKGITNTNFITSTDLKNLNQIIELVKNNHTKFIVESGTNKKMIDKIYTTLVESSGEGYTPQFINTTEMIQFLDEEKMEAEIKEDGDVLGNMKLYTESVVLQDNLDKELLEDMFKDLYKQTLLLNT